MKVIVAETYELLCEQLADRLLELVKGINNPLISPASGDSPAGLYRKLVEKKNKKEVEVKGWSFVGLDEWGGMNGYDEGSCKYHLDQQLFHPLEIEEHQICFFDGRSADLQVECERTEEFINEHGGIDVAILGLGMNGHLGMNEPGVDPGLHCHVTEIAALTQKVGQKYFKSEQKLSEGITLGIANLMKAKSLLIIVSGEHKSGIVQQFFEANSSNDLPATLVRDHPGLEIFLDKSAAQLIPAHDK